MGSIATSKPIIVFVHGAWHSPECFGPLTSQLSKAGYETLSVKLPSVDAHPPVHDFNPDVAAIRSTIEPLVEQGHEIILFMHSYGGIPGSEATKNLARSIRKANHLPGGVSSLIYCASLITPAGQSTLPDKSAFGVFGNVSDDMLTSMPTDPRNRFYGDLSEEEAAKWTHLLRPQSLQVFLSKSTHAAWEDIKATYIHCQNDQAWPIAKQKFVVQGLGSQNFDTVTLKASHSPFLSMPEKVSEIIRTVAGEQI